MNVSHVLARLFLPALLTLGNLSAQVVFSENFESTSGSNLPSGWTVTPGKFGATSTNPAPDSGDGSLRVLTFTAATINQDTFSPVFDLSSYKNGSQTIHLTFDFYSTATIDHPLLVGLNPNVTTGVTWIAGSPAQYSGVGAATFFSGSGTWQNVSVDLSSYVATHSTTELQTTYLAFERWSDASVASGASVFVDNVTVAAVPEPSIVGFACGAIGLVATWAARRISRKRISCAHRSVASGVASRLS